MLTPLALCVTSCHLAPFAPCASDKFASKAGSRGTGIAGHPMENQSGAVFATGIFSSSEAAGISRRLNCLPIARLSMTWCTPRLEAALFVFAGWVVMVKCLAKTHLDYSAGCL
jgi:hypothetical protein